MDGPTIPLKAIVHEQGTSQGKTDNHGKTSEEQRHCKSQERPCRRDDKNAKDLRKANIRQWFKRQLVEREKNREDEPRDSNAKNNPPQRRPKRALEQTYDISATTIEGGVMFMFLTINCNYIKSPPAFVDLRAVKGYFAATSIWRSERLRRSASNAAPTRVTFLPRRSHFS